jgi:hypothetical protein
MTVMAEKQMWRHPVTNRVKTSDNARYMEINGFLPYDGEYEKDKVTGVITADMSKAELQAEASALGLPTSGTKDEIRTRIAEAASTTSSTSAGDTEGSDPASGGE